MVSSSHAAAEKVVKRALSRVTRGDVIRYVGLAARNADLASFTEALFPGEEQYASTMFHLMREDLTSFLLKLDCCMSERFARWAVKRQGL